jgi:hypothetical protein
MPLRRRLVSLSQPQHQFLPPLRSSNLQTNRQPAFRKAARHRDSRQSPNIERPGVAQQLKFRRTQRVGISSKIGNRRRWDGHRRRNQQIHIGKELMRAAPFHIQLAPPLNILRGRNFLASPNAPQSLWLIKGRRQRNRRGVISVRLGRLHSAVRGDVDPYVPNIRHQRPDYDQSLLHGRANFVIKIVKKIIPRNTNTKILSLITQARNVIRHRNLSAASVKRIVSRDRLQHNRRIANSRSQRPNMIQRPRKRNHPASRHAPISRLDPHTPAQRRRFANRTSRVGPNRRITKPGSDGRRGSTGRPSGNMPCVPGVVNIAEETDQRTPAVSELVQIVLAQHHRTGLPQPPHNFRIFGRNAMLKHRAGSRSARARSIDQVFQGDRNPMQKPAPFTTRDLRLRRPRLRQSRLGSHGDKSVKRGVELLDAIQANPSQFDGRDFLPPQTRTKFNDSFQSIHLRELAIVVDSSVLPCVPLCPLCLRFLPEAKKQPTTKAYNQNRSREQGRKKWRK